MLSTCVTPDEGNSAHEPRPDAITYLVQIGGSGEASESSKEKATFVNIVKVHGRRHKLLPIVDTVELTIALPTCNTANRVHAFRRPAGVNVSNSNGLDNVTPVLRF